MGTMGTAAVLSTNMKVLLIVALCFVGALARNTERIVGGSNVGYAGKYPWQASLQFRSSSSHTCGASLISSRWLVCAAQINVISQSFVRQCRGFYGNIITGYHTCLLDSGRRTGSCNGDSGGPLSCQVGGTWYLAGATSFGVVNCPPSYPSVYASVPYFRSWIRTNTGV